MDLTQDSSYVRSAPLAAKLANITYRQLDHWERQGWVTASVVQQVGARRVRQYTDDDVIRLAALRHLALSGLDIASLGARIGATEMPLGTVLIVKGNDLEVVRREAALGIVCAEGLWAVFDPEPARRACADPSAVQIESQAITTDRKSA